MSALDDVIAQFGADSQDPVAITLLCLAALDERTLMATQAISHAESAWAAFSTFLRELQGGVVLAEDHPIVERRRVADAARGEIVKFRNVVQHEQDKVRRLRVRLSRG